MNDRWVWDDLNTRKENEQEFIKWHQQQPLLVESPALIIAETQEQWETKRTERQQSFLEWMGL